MTRRSLLEILGQLWQEVSKANVSFWDNRIVKPPSAFNWVTPLGN